VPSVTLIERYKVELSVAEVAGILRELAAKMKLVRYKKHPRPPKKAPPKRVSDKKQPHVSTARLLKERKKGRTESH
jgi:ribosomal protein S25